MKPTLYELSGHWARMEREGFVSLAAMARRFYKCADFDRAMGYLNAASHWHSGRGNASMASERLAKAWLKQIRLLGIMRSLAIPTKTASGEMLVVIAPAANVSKIKRILAMMDCEVEVMT
ncbi:MAG: hypothetical protein U5N55_07975 [Cypionkella sp.]|nr:hypothetical protein [Cypionkella sp.]